MCGEKMPTGGRRYVALDLGPTFTWPMQSPRSDEAVEHTPGTSSRKAGCGGKVGVPLWSLPLVVCLCLTLPHPAASQSTATFDFDAGIPILTQGQTIPFDQTASGLTAHFSSPTGASFSIQSDTSTGFKLSQFSGNYLYQNDLNRDPLDIKLSQAVQSITLTFATADFQQVEVPTTIQLAAYVDSTSTPPVGSATAHGTYGSDTMPMGTLTYSAGGQSFNLVEIVIPFQPLGAADFLVDNIRVTLSPVLTTISDASFAPNVALAASMIVAGFGQNLSSSTLSAPAGSPLPTSLAGITVKVKDSAGVERPCPLWFVGPGQINYYIPDGTVVGGASVTVSNQNQIVATGQLQIDPVSPGLFSMNSNGQGVAAALAVWSKLDGTSPWQYVFPPGCVPGSCVPTALDMGAPGDRLYLELFGTGVRGRSSLGAVSATIGGVPVPVEYAGSVAGMTGLDQVNLAVPNSLAGRGEVDVLLTVDRKVANPVRVSFK
jgi:uncharacterized protein (TIGR03437 family)